MKEKDIKKLSKKLDLLKIDLEHDINIGSSHDVLIYGDISTEQKDDILSRINIRFSETSSTSDVTVRIVNRSNVIVELFVCVITASGIKNITSTLDMRGLILGRGQINFTPALEIDEMDVSLDHRSTIGTYDLSQVEYLRSRGLSKEQSLDIIAKGFFEGIG